MNTRIFASAITGLAALSCPGIMLVGSAQNQFAIDATRQLPPPPRSRGPFPGSAVPGHSPGLPIQLELQIPTGEQRPDGTTLVDFVITNVGPDLLPLPASVDPNIGPTHILSLWLTSDAIKDVYFIDQQTGRQVKWEGGVGTSAELYGRSADPKTFHVLSPYDTIRVQASARVMLNPGRYSVTGHAELMRASPQVVGTADAEPITKTFSRPTGR
jgi:hypothetical protein